MSAEPKLEDLLGALLIFEYRFMGSATGGFATNDRSGRSTLVALPGREQQVVALAVRELVKRRARVILVSYRNETRWAERLCGRWINRCCAGRRGTRARRDGRRVNAPSPDIFRSR